jgi:toxin ParE1/3/4
MNVKFTPLATERLKYVYEYFKDKKQGKYGRLLRAKILQKALKLKDFPNLGQTEENLAHLELGHRYLIEGDYKIIYRQIGNDIWVTDIFDTRQDPGKMSGQ